MSTSQAVFAGWMEIPENALTDEARTRAEEETLAALVSQYSGTLYRVAFSVLRNPSDAEDAEFRNQLVERRMKSEYATPPSA